MKSPKEAFCFSRKTGERLTPEDGFPTLGDTMTRRDGVFIVMGWSMDETKFKIKHVLLQKPIEE